MSSLFALAARFEKYCQHPWKFKPTMWLSELKAALAEQGVEMGDVDYQLIKAMWAQAKDPATAANEIVTAIMEADISKDMPAVEPIVDEPFKIEAFQDAVLKIATNFKEEFQEWIEGFKLLLAKEGLDMKDVDLLAVHDMYRASLSPFEAVREIINGDTKMVDSVPEKKDSFFSKLFR